MVATSGRMMTADELVVLPDDGLRHELLEGELLSMAPSSDGQGLVAGTIAVLLGAADLQTGRGRVLVADTGYRLASHPDTVLAPDVAFLLKARVRPASERKGFPPGAPDLAVEVLSPSNSASEMARKVDHYLRAGATLVWLVDPERRSVAVYQRGGETRFLREDDEIDAGELIPGFRRRVADFFL
ncbi:MAG: Uma2 family endonuclease [Dehalococcoidia bacterium]|nr:Uma2 family endonuclease [Dehalococcoidia bacterium]